MLQKIICIKNVGRFQNCVPTGDVTFRKASLIFAENGRGKTTLCAILRSLSTNTPALIIGRATLGSTTAPEVRLLVGDNNIVFRDGVWNFSSPNISVFDGTYVSENVFAGDIIDTEHRRNLYRIIIGAQGITLAERVTELDNQIRAKNNEIRDVRAHLQRYTPHGMTVEAFIALAEDVDIDIKIVAKEQERTAIQNIVQLQRRPELSAIAVPIFPATFSELLAKTFQNLTQNAEENIARHIKKHQMQARGEPWLTEGLRYTVGDLCPFCGQSLRDIDLIQSYKDFFSKEYYALRDKVARLSEDINSVIGDHICAVIEQTLLQNNNNVEFWQQYCAITPPILSEAMRLRETITTLRRSAQSLLQIKASTPLDSVPPDDTFTRALTNFETLRTSINNYNTSVATANAIIAAKKQVTQAADIRVVDASLVALKTQKARYAEDAQRLCMSDVALQNAKQALENDKGRAKEQLDAHTQHVIEQYGQSINRYLERINAGFRITIPTHTYRGGAPSTSYQIVINQCVVDLGDSETSPATPSFKNTLSAGDRSTLALAFFLAQLEQDPERRGKIVVFDDPFTSLDGFRRNHTVHQIYKCVSSCAQVIVLSHDATFLKLLWDRILPADRKTLLFARIGEEDTAIVEWDIERAVMARYHAHIEDLQRFFSDNEGDPRNVIQKLRPTLESYCRHLYPTEFGDRDTLGIIVGKIRTAGSSQSLYSIVDDLDELNIYCRRYHHGENPSAATEPIDDAELRGYVKRTLKIVGYIL